MGNTSKILTFTSLFFLLIITQSCVIKDNPIVKIKNNSKFLIDSAELFAHPDFKKMVIKNIKPNESRKGIILFDGIPKQDGVSGAILYYNNKEKYIGLGYYTNGASLDYGFKIEIENDTVFVNRY